METIKWCYCVQGKRNGTLNNELVKAVGKSLMQGVGLNLVLTLSQVQAVPRWQKTGKRHYFRSRYQAFFTPTRTYSLPSLLIWKSSWLRCGGISSCFLPFLLGIILNLCGPHFHLHSQACFPHLLFGYILNSPPPQQPFPPHHHTSLLHSLPSASLPGRLQIGYFPHALSRALISGRVLIVGLSLRLTDSSACAAEMPDLVNVCLWCLISSAYINCLDSMCRQSLSILLRCLPPPSVSTSPFSLYSVLRML